MEKRNKTLGYRFVKLVSSPFNHKPKFIYKEDINEIPNAIFICNHNFEKGPTKWSMHFPYECSIWGNYLFTGSVRGACAGLADAYIRGGTPKWFAKVIGFFGGPFVRFGFKHSNVIPVYKDMRMFMTFKQSVEDYEKGKNIILFPEDSSDGYKYEIEKIMPGFLILARQLKEKGHDPYIICAEESPKSKKIIVDKPLKLSQLDEMFKSDEEILEYFRTTINNLYMNYCKENNIDDKHIEKVKQK